MKIYLANGMELNPIMVTGGKQSVQGAYRDILNFVFPEGTSMDELDNAFTAANCESVAIVGDDGEYIHKAYTVRACLKRELVEVEPETPESEAVYENRVFVAMGQRTYSESLIASLKAQLEA